LQDNRDKDIAAFKKNIGEDRDVIRKIESFIKILDFHQEKINLIGKSTRLRIWDRHILDSAQIKKYLHKENKENITLDVGSGAGFPGIILSILGREDILLCEKSKKKANFLKIVVKELKLKVKIFDGRIEDYKKKNVKTLVARAFSPLKSLLAKVKHLTNEETVLVLHKGERYYEEIKDAKGSFSFNWECLKSLTNPSAKILKIKNISEIYEY